MRRDSLMIILMLAHNASACTGTSQPSHPRHTGGGIIVYWNSDLRVMPRLAGSIETLLAASVTGLQTVEVLDVSPDRTTATPMPSIGSGAGSGCYPLPISLGVFTDEAEGTGIAVEDVCGNYLVQSATTEAKAAAWDPGLAPYTLPYMETGIDATGRWVLAFAGEFTAFFFRREGAAWNSIGEFPMPFDRGVHMTRVVMPIADDVWPIQGGGEIDLVNVSALPGLVQPKIMTQREIRAPYLVDFGGYDHLSAVPWAICPQTLIGVGTFPHTGGPSPRRLVVLDLANQDGVSYSARDFGPSGFEATNVASVPWTDGKTIVVGSVGTAGAVSVFKAFEITGCGLPVEVAEMDAEFEFRTPPLPGFGPDIFQPRSEGAKFAAYLDASSNVATFAHYDGYDLRLFKVEKSANGWGARQETTKVHDTREDLSVPARE